MWKTQPSPMSRASSSFRKALPGSREKENARLKELVVCAWERKYRVLILPEYRKKVFLGKARKRIAEILQDVWKQWDRTDRRGSRAGEHAHLSKR